MGLCSRLGGGPVEIPWWAQLHLCRIRRVGVARLSGLTYGRESLLICHCNRLTRLTRWRENHHPFGHLLSMKDQEASIRGMALEDHSKKFESVTGWAILLNVGPKQNHLKKWIGNFIFEKTWKQKKKTSCSSYQKKKTKWMVCSEWGFERLCSQAGGGVRSEPSRSGLDQGGGKWSLGICYYVIMGLQWVSKWNTLMEHLFSSSIFVKCFKLSSTWLLFL